MAYICTLCTHTHTLSCLSSYLQLLPLHSAHTHSPPQQLQLILVPVAGIKAVTYRPVNLHTLPVMPLHFSNNAAEILWKVIWGPLPSTHPPPLLLLPSPSPSSTSSSVQRSERWDGGINTLPPKPTLGMIDGQMQEGSGGGEGEIKGEKSEGS